MKKIIFIVLILIQAGIVTSLMAQGNILGATITSGIEMKLDSLNVTLKRLIKVEQINIQLADSTNKLYKQNLKIAADLNKLTEYNSELTKRLVKLSGDNIQLANENKKISSFIQLHTKQLVNLDSQNIKVQSAIKGLTDQLVNSTNENKLLSSKLVESAKQNDKSSTRMLWASYAMIVLASLQLIPIFKRKSKIESQLVKKSNLSRKQFIMRNKHFHNV